MEKLVPVPDVASGLLSMERKSTQSANGKERLISSLSKPVATGKENHLPPNNVTVAAGNKSNLDPRLPKRTRNVHLLVK
jgi:hypothetical protein